MSEPLIVRVISLKNQLRRRERMKALFLDSALQWDFFDAIPGSNIEAYIHHYDRVQRRKFPGHDLTNNEIACFISHREMWKKCADSGACFLILEDDAYILRENFSVDTVQSIYESIYKVMGDDFIVRLGNGAYKNEKKIINKLSDDFLLCRYRRDPLCALAYILTPKAAKRLIVNSETFYLPVDDYMWNGNESKSMVLDVSPVLFSAEVEGNPSTIGDRKKKRVGFFEKIKIEFRRIIFKIRLRGYEGKIYSEVGGLND